MLKELFQSNPKIVIHCFCTTKNKIFGESKGKVLTKSKIKTHFKKGIFEKSASTVSKFLGEDPQLYKVYIVSVLGREEGYTVKYTPLPEGVPEGEARGNF